MTEQTTPSFAWNHSTAVPLVPSIGNPAAMTWRPVAHHQIQSLSIPGSERVETWGPGSHQDLTITGGSSEVKTFRGLQIDGGPQGRTYAAKWGLQYPVGTVSLQLKTLGAGSVSVGLITSAVEKIQVLYGTQGIQIQRLQNNMPVQTSDWVPAQDLGSEPALGLSVSGDEVRAWLRVDGSWFFVVDLLCPSLQAQGSRPFFTAIGSGWLVGQWASGLPGEVHLERTTLVTLLDGTPYTKGSKHFVTVSGDHGSVWSVDLSTGLMEKTAILLCRLDNGAYDLTGDWSLLFDPIEDAWTAVYTSGQLKEIRRSKLKGNLLSGTHVIDNGQVLTTSAKVAGDANPVEEPQYLRLGSIDWLAYTVWASSGDYVVLDKSADGGKTWSRVFQGEVGTQGPSFARVGTQAFFIHESGLSFLVLDLTTADELGAINLGQLQSGTYMLGHAVTLIPRPDANRTEYYALTTRYKRPLLLKANQEEQGFAVPALGID